LNKEKGDWRQEERRPEEGSATWHESEHAGAKLCFVPTMSSASGGTKGHFQFTGRKGLSLLYILVYTTMLVPPEAADTVSTKQSFAPARDRGIGFKLYPPYPSMAL
jgi:hypothetical protein